MTDELTIVETHLSRARQEERAADEVASRVVLTYLTDVVMPLLGLEAWTVVLDLDHAPPDGTWAMIEADPEDHYSARLYLASSLLAATPEQRRNTLVHEALHIRFLPLTEYARRTIAKVLTGDAYAVWWEGMRQHVELETDGLARAIAEVIPLPDDNYVRVPPGHPLLEGKPPDRRDPEVEAPAPRKPRAPRRRSTRGER